MTEARALIRMVQYYGYLWPRLSHVLAPTTEAAISPKGRAILWNDYMEVAFHDLNGVVYEDTLLDYLNCKILFIVHTNSSDKKLGDVISKDDKTVA